MAKRNRAMSAAKFKYELRIGRGQRVGEYFVF